MNAEQIVTRFLEAVAAKHEDTLYVYERGDEVVIDGYLSRTDLAALIRASVDPIPTRHELRTEQEMLDALADVLLEHGVPSGKVLRGAVRDVEFQRAWSTSRDRMPFGRIYVATVPADPADEMVAIREIERMRFQAIGEYATGTQAGSGAL